jgi:hypothetical protein
MVSIRALSVGGCGFAVKGDEIAVNGRYRLSIVSNFLRRGESNQTFYGLSFGIS